MSGKCVWGGRDECDRPSKHGHACSDIIFKNSFVNFLLLKYFYFSPSTSLLDNNKKNIYIFFFRKNNCIKTLNSHRKRIVSISSSVEHVLHLSDASHHRFETTVDKQNI